ncbi:MAG: hypothetical protein Q8N89_15555 [Azonexus sp.]|nr:hypothetical protein [Azonexus sp.]
MQVIENAVKFYPASDDVGLLSRIRQIVSSRCAGNFGDRLVVTGQANCPNRASAFSACMALLVAGFANGEAGHPRSVVSFDQNIFLIQQRCI